MVRVRVKVRVRARARVRVRARARARIRLGLVAMPGVHETRAEEERDVGDRDHRVYGRRALRPEGVLHRVADGQQ